MASELPRERSTLLVRIMAAGPELADAVKELAALPADAHERTVAGKIVIHLQRALSRKPGRTAEEEELIVKVDAYIEQLQKEGLKRGRRQEAARALLTVLEARGIAVSDAQRKHIQSQKNRARLERWLKKAVVAATVEDVLDEAS